MRKSEEDEKRIRIYEKAARAKEYGHLSSNRQRLIQKTGLLIAAVLILFTILLFFMK